MTHPTPDQLSAHLDGALQDAAFDLVRRHLEWCEPCRAQCMRVASATEVLAALLTHDADDRFFATLERFLEDQFKANTAADAIPPELEQLLAKEAARLEGHRKAAVGQVIPRTFGGAARAPRAESRAETAGPAVPAATAAPTWESRRRRRVGPGAPRPASAVVVPAAHRSPPETTLPAAVPGPAAARLAARTIAKEARPLVPEPRGAPRPAMAPSPASRRTGTTPRSDRAGRIVGAAVVALIFLVAGLYLGSIGRPPWIRDSYLPTGAHPSGAGGRVPVVTRTESPPGSQRVDSSAKDSAAPVPPAAPAVKGSERPETVAVSSPSAPAPRAAAASPAPTPASSPPAASERGILCGQIRDPSGAPIAGAQVLLADLRVGALTDPHGRFCISAPAGSRTVSVMALGFATQSRIVRIGRRTPEIAFVLETRAVKQSSRSGSP